MTLFVDTFNLEQFNPDDPDTVLGVLANLLEDIQCLKEDLTALEGRNDILTALEVGGVDNWGGYSESLDNAGLIEE